LIPIYLFSVKLKWIHNKSNNFCEKKFTCFQRDISSLIAMNRYFWKMKQEKFFFFLSRSPSSTGRKMPKLLGRTSMTGVRSLVTPFCVCEFMMVLPFHLCTNFFFKEVKIINWLFLHFQPYSYIFINWIRKFTSLIRIDIPGILPPPPPPHTQLLKKKNHVTWHYYKINKNNILPNITVTKL
jgi:hypothetical protein